MPQAAPTVAPRDDGLEARKASAQIRRMRRSLRSWLRYRRINDEVAVGMRKARVPQRAAARTLHAERDYRTEQQLADKLYALLSEVGDSSGLPNPDLGKDPEAAVKLAEIVLTGKLPDEAQGPSAQGVIWMWPVLIVGGVVFVIATAVRSYADVAKEQERLKCIRDGACTDYGFWLKLGGIAFVGWLAWSRFGGRELAGFARRKAGGGSKAA